MPRGSLSRSQKQACSAVQCMRALHVEALPESENPTASPDRLGLAGVSVSRRPQVLCRRAPIPPPPSPPWAAGLTCVCVYVRYGWIPHPRRGPEWWWVHGVSPRRPRMMVMRTFGRQLSWVVVGGRGRGSPPDTARTHGGVCGFWLIYGLRRARGRAKEKAVCLFSSGRWSCGQSVVAACISQYLMRW